MNNHDNYQKAFSKIRTSLDYAKTVKEMKQTTHFYFPKAVALGLGLLLVLGASSAVYAYDVGGIRKAIAFWFHGNQTSGIMEFDSEGSYTLNYTDENGEDVTRQGGGYALEDDGQERPLTAEELMEGLDSPELEYKEDGSIWIYYQDQKIDITNQFDANGICHISISSQNGQTLDITVEGTSMQISYSEP